MTDVCMIQPGERAAPEPTDSPSPGPVAVRYLTGTEDDRLFAGRMMVEAFEQKLVHATSRGSLPDMRDSYANSLRGRPPEFYERHLVAEYNGERAGSCVLRYHGDSELFLDREEDMAPVGCTDFCGLELLNKATKEDIAIGTCSINHLAVDSCFRRKGIGKILLNTAEKDALRHGCSVMDLLVASSNKARLFFEGQGYRALETDTGCCCGLWCMTGVWKLIRMEKKLS